MVLPFIVMMSLSALDEHAAKVAAANKVTAPARIFFVFFIEKLSPFIQ